LKRILLAMLIVVGCSSSSVRREDIGPLTECFSVAAYEAVRTGLTDPETPAECCKSCGKNGLPPGKVLSGDGQQVVNCPCPDSCECKRSKSLIPPRVLR
jgi:hypothetical protein